jgi:DNA replication and repair protein RecF
MQVRRLELVRFRNYDHVVLEPAPGLTAVLGDNGQGKSNLVEALGFLATLESFRGAPTDAMVATGADRAVVRADLDRDGRAMEVEAEVPRVGRTRAQINRQRLQRSRDLLGALRVTVFAPDDLILVKGGPGERRRYLDELVVALHPRNDALRAEVERVLRQRGALLKQAGGRLSAEVETTLDVWDMKLAEAGEALAAARAAALDALAPALAAAYDDLAARPSAVRATYEAPWRGVGLAAALVASRNDDVRRGVTTVGPHRDDLGISIEDRPSRTHASQGEQRTLALAMRLAAHRVVDDRIGTPPVLLLDDVFSELDPTRSAALLRHLPAGQTLLTTAGGLPEGTHPELVVRVAAGRIAP